MTHLFHGGTKLKQPLREKWYLVFRKFMNRFFVFLIPHHCGSGDISSVISESQNHFLPSCCFHISLWCTGLTVTIVNIYVSSTFPKSLPIFCHTTLPLYHHHAPLSIGGEFRYQNTFRPHSPNPATNFFLEACFVKSLPLYFKLHPKIGRIDSWVVCCILRLLHVITATT